MIKSYNNNYNERYLVILLLIKIYRNDRYIKDGLKYHIHHICKKNSKYCLDEKLFNIETVLKKEDTFKIDSRCMCLCEEGMNYFFRILKLLNPTKLKFCMYYYTIFLIVNYYLVDIHTPADIQSLFGSYFCQLSNLQRIDFSSLKLTSDFVESFIKSIPSLTNLKYIDLACIYYSINLHLF